jgi:cbb3-type cytochrome oxidase cytochrome c subunit
MQVAKRDWIFLAVIVAVLGALYAGTGMAKAKNVPDDEKHSRFYETMHKGGDRLEVEKGCATCHGIQSRPLSRAHPPKEQCLLCHKLFPADRQGQTRQ